MSSSGMEGRRERRGWRRCGPIEGEEEGERSGHRVDPLGRRAVTKRFANPPRSRATRGRENARWIEARSPLPLDRRRRRALLVQPRHGGPVPPFFSREFSSNLRSGGRRGFLEASFCTSSPLLAMRWSGCAATAEVSERGSARVNRKPTTSTRSPPPPSIPARVPLRLLGCWPCHPRARTSPRRRSPRAPPLTCCRHSITTGRIKG